MRREARSRRSASGSSGRDGAEHDAAALPAIAQCRLVPTTTTTKHFAQRHWHAVDEAILGQRLPISGADLGTGKLPPPHSASRVRLWRPCSSSGEGVTHPVMMTGSCHGSTDMFTWRTLLNSNRPESRVSCACVGELAPPVGGSPPQRPQPRQPWLSRLRMTMTMRHSHASA